MTISSSSNFLRAVLLIDATTCVATGLLMAVGATPVSWLTAIPPALLFYAGLSLFPIAAFMALTAARATLSPLAVWIVIAGNALWVIASLALMAGGWIEPNGWGHAFIGVQALAVAILAKLEYAGLQKLPGAGAARGRLREVRQPDSP